MEENTELDSEFDAEEIPSPSDLWNYMEHYWHNNREFPENTEDLLKRKADLIEGKVPSSQLPNYVNDILEFESLENLPNPGEKGKIYIITKNNTQFRWSGSEYIQLNSEEYLMTTNTQQDIGVKKWFYTSGGYGYQNHSLGVMSQDGSYPGIAFYRGGTNIGNIVFDGTVFSLLKDDTGTGAYLGAEGYYKTGSNNDYVLTGGGSHKPISDFITETSWNNITGKKWFKTDGGNNWDNNTARIHGINGYDAGLTFYRDGIDVGQIIFDGYNFKTTNSNNDGYKPIISSHFIKNGSDANHVLLGDGEHKPLSDFATSAQLGNYLPLSGGTLTGGGRIRDNGNIYIQQVNVGGNATGLFWETMDDSAFTAGIGAYTENGNFYWHYLGWGAYPWSTATSLAVGENIFTYKDNQVWHEGNLNPLQVGSAIQVDSTDYINNGSNIRSNKTWFDYGWADTYAGSVINFSGYPNNNYSTELFGQYNAGGNRFGLRTHNGDTNTWNPVRWIWHDGNFDPGNYLTNRGNWHNALLAKTDFPNSVTEYADDPSITGFKTTWGTSLHIKGNGPWHNRLDFNTNGRLDWWQGINTTDMTYKGQIAVIPDGVENWTSANFNPNDKVTKSGDTMTGALKINTSSGHLVLSESNINKWHIESIGGEFNLVETGVAQRFRISPNASTPTYNGYGLWHAGNFNPDMVVKIGGAGTTNNPIYFRWTGSELQLTVDTTTIGNLWHTSNFNPNTKANASENARAIGFSSGNYPSQDGSQFPYFYYDNGSTAGYIPLATQDFVNYRLNTKVDKSGDIMTGGLTVTTPDSIGSGNLGTLPTNLKLFLSNGTQYGTVFWTEGTGQGFIQQQRADGQQTAYDLRLQPLGGILYYGDSEVAKVDWVNTNFIPKTHPVYNITQANIDSWVTYGYLDNALTDYAHKADANTFTKVNTFELSPIVPTGSNGSHAVNVAQLFEVAATQAVETVNSKFITEMMNTTFAAFDMSGMGYPTILTVIAKSDGELRVEEVKDGRSVKVRNVSSGNLEVRINGGTTTIVSANEWADYHSDGSGDITMTSQAGCYII